MCIIFNYLSFYAPAVFIILYYLQLQINLINYYNRNVLVETIWKLYNIQGYSIMRAITIGNNIVQQNDINWSYLILGKEALAQMNTNTIIQDLKLRLIPLNKPFNEGSEKGSKKRLLLDNEIFGWYMRVI